MLQYSACPNGIGGLLEPAIVRAVEAGRDFRLFDETGLDTDMPDGRALELAARFSIPIRWTHVSREIERRRAPSYVTSAYAAVSGVASRVISSAWDPFARGLWSLWRLVPSRVRIWAYSKLYRAGRAIYGPTDTKVQRLPFNLFIKYRSVSSPGLLINEHDALQLIRKNSDLMVPQPLDFVSDSKWSYMVTARVPGYQLSEVFSMLTDEQLHALAMDLNEFLSKLRAIPKGARSRTAPMTAVTGAAGGDCHHVRMELMFGKGTYGPFTTEQDFHDFIRPRRPAAPGEIQRGGHDIVMTHGDLSRRNVIVDKDGRLVGVVDWEHAGWYPTYWEFTSFRFGLDSLHNPQRLVDMGDVIFQGFGDFEHELGVERRLWERIF
ncbi:kinase-like protein [Trichocladium antarcticum]|uniref:Kinase-like protein n=1 Tax=Trichocladium antarcticum TaxID=1450529 RepID=A0AAN6UCV3_9PEZI|nr:kinase-like protein [Trichocladium antarcticum]